MVEPHYNLTIQKQLEAAAVLEDPHQLQQMCSNSSSDAARAFISDIRMTYNQSRPGRTYKDIADQMLPPMMPDLWVSHRGLLTSRVR
jgi:cell pole-organizing protein PopZ